MHRHQRCIGRHGDDPLLHQFSSFGNHPHLLHAIRCTQRSALASGRAGIYLRRIPADQPPFFAPPFLPPLFFAPPFWAPPFWATFAQVSRSVTVRLNTIPPGSESASVQK